MIRFIGATIIRGSDITNTHNLPHALQSVGLSSLEQLQELAEEEARTFGNPDRVALDDDIAKAEAELERKFQRRAELLALERQEESLCNKVAKVERIIASIEDEMAKDESCAREQEELYSTEPLAYEDDIYKNQNFENFINWMSTLDIRTRINKNLLENQKRCLSDLKKKLKPILKRKNKLN